MQLFGDIRLLYRGRITGMICWYFPTGTRVTRPAGGFSLWVELPGDVDTMSLYAHAETEKISIAPGRIFSSGGKYNNCLRLNGAFWSEENRWAVESLGRMANQLNEK